MDRHIDKQDGELALSSTSKCYISNFVLIEFLHFSTNFTLISVSARVELLL